MTTPTPAATPAPTTSASQVPLSPTTGESMNVIARRGRVGLWFIIVMSVSGTIALIISYSYLWSLNVNGGWAPPGAKLTANQTNNTIGKLKGDFAPEWPFWAIMGVVIVATAFMWWGYRSVRTKGNHGALVAGSTLALIFSIAALVAQWIQISTFPFGPTNGAYASAVLLLCASNIFNLLIVIFVLIGIVNRSRKGLINKLVWYQAQAASYWMTWVVIAFLMGVIVTTFMVESPNTDPSIFGGFKQQ
jgi:hypothetical protein